MTEPAFYSKFPDQVTTSQPRETANSTDGCRSLLDTLPRQVHNMDRAIAISVPRDRAACATIRSLQQSRRPNRHAHIPKPRGTWV